MNNTLFQLGNITIYKYSVCILIGIISAIIVIIINNKRYNINKDDLSDIIFYTLLLGIVGTRIYYVIFNLDYYLKNPQEIIMISNGGLAIHGGLLLGLITIICLTKKRNIELFNLLDIISPRIILAQSIGRWGNYFNGEAHGGPTDLPWGILVDGVKVHPTFLYESIWCLLLFFFLSWWDRNKRQAYGQTIALYGILYSIERFFVESLRTDSLMIGPFKQAQVISICAIIVSAVLYIYSKKHFPLTQQE